MAVITQLVDIQSTCACVWSRLTDFERMPEWFSGVKRVSVQSPQLGVGAERLLTIVTGQSYHERFVEWEEQRAFRFEVLNPPPFAERWTAGVVLSPTPNGVRLRWEIRYTSRFGAPGAAFDAFLAAPVMNALLRRSLGRLRAEIENAAT